MAVNGMYIVQGEMGQVVMALRRSRRWAGAGSAMAPPHHPNSPSIDEHDPLLRGFADLRDVLHTVSDLSDIHPSDFLSPFLEVIRSVDTSGPVTGLALMAISKFLSYGLIDSSSLSAPSAVEQVADAITHARFVGADPGSDEVILMKILHVLRTLLLTPVGSLLTNTMVCEILQSCFRICFEPRLSELLRRAAEFALSDMIQLLFTRLPTFKEDPNDPYIRKLKMKANFGHAEIKRRKKHYRHKKQKSSGGATKADGSQESPAMAPEANEKRENGQRTESPGNGQDRSAGDADGGAPVPVASERGEPDSGTDADEATAPRPRLPSTTVVNLHGNLVAQEMEPIASEDEGATGGSGVISPQDSVVESPNEGSARSISAAEESGRRPSVGQEGTAENVPTETPKSDPGHENVTSKESSPADGDDQNDDADPPLKLSTDRPRSKSGGTGHVPGENTNLGPLVPYGLPCIRELFRFLISLANPLDKENTETMIQLGLSLLTIALEAGADYLGTYSLLIPLVRNELSRNLLSLLATDRMPLFASTLRCCFIMFEALRTHLKLQLESYLMRLMELVVSEHPKVTFEQKEMALEAIVQLWCIPGLVTELFLNYDCDLYCSNLFEDLTKLLSKNSFPVVGIYSTHILSLDALLTVVETIEANCHARVAIMNQAERNKAQNELEKRLSVGQTPGQPPIPTPCGLMAGRIQTGEEPLTIPSSLDLPPQVRPNRMPVIGPLPSHEDLVVQKKRKKILTTGTELFNQNAGKGIAYLQEHLQLKTPLDPEQAVAWIRENPRLGKKMIGEWIASRKNSAVLKAFVNSFNFEGVRIDDALRAFLETFRLIGEAPVISMIMEHFAEHWSTQNGDPFHDKDAAFTLAFGIIMLNTDQHNMNVRKQIEPMTAEKFKHNLRGVNGGEDFNEEFLDDIYHAIRNEEIVMPEEHTGVLRESYLWKVLLRRSQTQDGVFRHAPPGLYDHDLFSLIWGPTVAAIAFVYDKSTNDSIITKCMNGFWKCADIAAHYGMSDVFDNQIISLCKFSGLMSLAGTQDYPNFDRDLAVAFGENQKAQFAAKAMFELVHRHGDILREGWKNILECLLQLYRARLLPESLTEVVDFVDPKGWVSIARERVSKPKEEAGLFSSLYTLLGSSSDVKEVKVQTPEEQEFIRVTQQVVLDCNPAQIIDDSRYLTAEALCELTKAIAVVSNAYMQTGGSHGELVDLNQYYLLFLMELMVNVTLENKDRVTPHWKSVKSHLYRLLTVRSPLVVERALVNLIRLVSRLMFREEMAPEMLKALAMLLGLPAKTLKDLSAQLSHGLHHLLKTNAADIHQKADWQLIFMLLEIAGAAAFPNSAQHDQAVNNRGTGGARSPNLAPQDHGGSVSPHGEHDRGYTSDSELYVKQGTAGSVTSEESGLASGGSAEWAHVNEQGELVPPAPDTGDPYLLGFNPEALTLRKELHKHNPRAFLKSCETLAFLVRDAAHITPENFESCLACLRTFTEASINGGRHEGASSALPSLKSDGELHRLAGARGAGPAPASGKEKKKKKAGTGEPSVHEAQRSEEEIKIQDSYNQVSLQLLDLTHTLHVKAADIFTRWKQTMPEIDVSGPVMWERCWKPALQCLAKSCTDVRKQIRTTALTYLQRSLLIHDLQDLEPPQWEECFTAILFPLLAHLRYDISMQTDDSMGIEEARCRTLALLCKVFLQHLNPLLNLSDFTALWVTILDFNRQFYQPERADVLLEAIPESLKNMLLVMDTAGIFATCPNLYQLTVSRLETFLPSLMSEIFPHGRRSAEPERPVADPEEPQEAARVPVPAPDSDPNGAQTTDSPSSEIDREGPTPDRSGDVPHSALDTSRPYQQVEAPPVSSSVDEQESIGIGTPVLERPELKGHDHDEHHGLEEVVVVPVPLAAPGSPPYLTTGPWPSAPSSSKHDSTTSLPSDPTASGHGKPAPLILSASSQVITNTERQDSESRSM